MDFITIKNLKVFAYHGVYPEEREKGQHFYVNAKLFLDMERAARTDDLTGSVHYGEVCEQLHAFLRENRYQLLERAVTETIRHILLLHPMLRGMELELCKPEAPIELPFENVSVTRSLFWHTAYIALGSNMGDRKKYLDEAVEKLALDNNFRNLQTSAYRETAPYGGVEQADFLNGALRVETLLAPAQLLGRLHALEQEAGRERSVRWGPRTLDLDILFYDDIIMDTEKLTIPHPDLQNRQFVLEPMCDLAPFYRHPLLLRTMRELLTALTASAGAQRPAPPQSD